MKAVDRDCIHIAWAERLLELRPLARGELSLLQGWYCPEFGVRYANPVVRWTAVMPLLAACGWSLAWSSPASRQMPLGQACLAEVGAETVVEWNEMGRTVRLYPRG